MFQSLSRVGVSLVLPDPLRQTDGAGREEYEQTGE